MTAADADTDATSDVLHRVLDMAMRFKLQPDIFRERLPPERIRDILVVDLPREASTLDAVLESFEKTILPLCKNEASPRFLGFGDTGDDLASLVGGVLALFTQQNLINQSFDAPSATFVEIAVLRWLRDLVGYDNPAVTDIHTVDLAPLAVAVAVHLPAGVVPGGLRTVGVGEHLTVPRALVRQLATRLRVETPGVARWLRGTDGERARFLFG